MKRVLVIGIGRFGRAVIETLAQAKAVEVIAVDEQMEPVNQVRDQVTVAARVDSLDAQALAALGASEVDVAVVSIGEDFEAAVLTVAVLKELGIRQIVARAQTDRRRRVLESVGATQVVMVEPEMGRRVAHALLGSQVLDRSELGGGVALVHWSADQRVLGRSVKDLDFMQRWELMLVAVKHGGAPEAGGGQVTVAPSAGYLFRPGDVLLLCGSDARLEAFTR
jgi:trk system potassium uptake protein TrkA